MGAMPALCLHGRYACMGDMPANNTVHQLVIAESRKFLVS
jgi:hypothetical protein